jgi:hypothetical protein
MMAIAIAVPLAFGAAGTAWAMSSDSSGVRPIRDLIPPKPSPSSDAPQLPKPVQKVLSGTQGDTESPEGDATDSPGANDRGATDSRRAPTNANSLSGLTWSWTVPYGGWRRFLQAGEWPYASSSVTYASVPAHVVPAVGATTVSPVAAIAPQTPAYLWVLLPLGLIVIWAASMAVFEPVEERGRVILAIRSVRRTAREAPAGMTRSFGRTTVRVVGRFISWGRR